MAIEIRDLLIGTLLLSIALAPLHAILPERHGATLLGDRVQLLLVAVAAVFNLVVIVPCIWVRC